MLLESAAAWSLRGTGRTVAFVSFGHTFTGKCKFCAPAPAVADTKSDKDKDKDKKAKKEKHHKKEKEKEKEKKEKDKKGVTVEEATNCGYCGIFLCGHHATAKKDANGNDAFVCPDCTNETPDFVHALTEGAKRKPRQRIERFL
jgi:hypothetical protein